MQYIKERVLVGLITDISSVKRLKKNKINEKQICFGHGFVFTKVVAVKGMTPIISSGGI